MRGSLRRPKRGAIPKQPAPENSHLPDARQRVAPLRQRVQRSSRRPLGVLGAALAEWSPERNVACLLLRTMARPPSRRDRSGSWRDLCICSSSLAGQPARGSAARRRRVYETGRPTGPGRSGKLHRRPGAGTPRRRQAAPKRGADSLPSGSAGPFPRETAGPLTTSEGYSHARAPERKPERRGA